MQPEGSSQGCTTMQVDSSDEECAALLAALGESHESQRLAWSQVISVLTPNASGEAPIRCSQAEVIHSSQDEEDSRNTEQRQDIQSSSTGAQSAENQMQSHLWKHEPSEPVI